MTYEEAIKILTELKPIPIDGFKTIAGAYDLAIEALKKQTPKKPTSTRGKYGHTECACCGWVVESFCGDLEQYPFCPNCGQATDWEDDE